MSALLGKVRILSILEVQTFAYPAVRSLKGLPITFPTTTRVSRPMTGGVLHRAG